MFPALLIPDYLPAQLPLLLLLFFVIRLLPLWPGRHRGCDAYFALAFIDPLRSAQPPSTLACGTYDWLQRARLFREGRRKMSPEEGQGSCAPRDDRQTNPLEDPGFPWLLSWIPEKPLERWFWVLNPLLDAACLVALLALIGVELGSGPLYLLALLYAVSPNLTNEFCRLSVRALALPLFLGFIGFTFHWAQSGAWIGLGAAMLLGLALLWVHRASVGLLWLLIPFFALLFLKPAYLAPLLLAEGAHWLILAIFTQRGGGWIGDRSRGRGRRQGGEPERGGGPKRGPPPAAPLSLRALFHRIYHRIKILILLNPLLLTVIYLLMERPPRYTLADLIVYWVVGVYLAIGLTFLFPALPRWQRTSELVLYAEWPSLFAIALFLGQDYLRIEEHVALYLFCAMHLVHYGIRWRWLAGAGRRWCALERGHLQTLFETIRLLERPRLICRPALLAGLTAYRTGQRVMGEGQSGDPAQVTAATHLLADETYPLQEPSPLVEARMLQRAGPFVLYALPPRP